MGNIHIIFNVFQSLFYLHLRNIHLDRKSNKFPVFNLVINRSESKGPTVDSYCDLVLVRPCTFEEPYVVGCSYKPVKIEFLSFSSPSNNLTYDKSVSVNNFNNLICTLIYVNRTCSVWRSEGGFIFKSSLFWFSKSGTLGLVRVWKRYTWD